DTGEFNGIPFLKDVKYIGPLFRSRDTNVRESELIVFIMPEIVGYDEPLDCRDQRALDTVHCRLEAVPAAEGCPSPGECARGELIPLPPVDDAPGWPQETATSTPAEQSADLRAGFDKRFRAASPTSRLRTR
ncbi:MAG: hypothetical protein KDA61_09950, partial [Planctomycetales bacterium]|nr:hypothetical protein [Planctomycetales bacterium]